MITIDHDELRARVEAGYELQRDDSIALLDEIEVMKNDAEVMRLLSTGEWKLTKMLPSKYLTEEANAKFAWMVERQLPPYGTQTVRYWKAPTAYEAFALAIAAMEDKNQ